MDLRLIETFIQAARRESFSAAARALGVSPGAVSQNIKALEAQLAVRLFNRTTRQVRLTTEGARFLAQCAPAVEALAEAAEIARDAQDRLSGTLRVTSTTAFGRSEILPLITSFQDQHPDLQVELSLSDGFVDLVAEGFDLAIRGGVLPDSNYVARLLLPVTPLVCAAPAYLARSGTPERLKDLAEHRLIGFRAAPSQRVFAWEFRDRRPLAIDPALVVNEPEAAALAAVAGAGIAQVGSNVVLPHVAAGRLRELFADQAVQSRGLYAVYPSRRFMPRKLRLFVDHLVEAFATRHDLIPQ